MIGGVDGGAVITRVRVLLAMCVLAWLASFVPHARAQGQGVGVTVTQTSSSPGPTASPGPGGPPGSNASPGPGGGNGGTNVGAGGGTNSGSGGAGTGGGTNGANTLGQAERKGPLPGTGAEIALYVLIGLALIATGVSLIGAAYARRRSRAHPQTTS